MRYHDMEPTAGWWQQSLHQQWQGMSTAMLRNVPTRYTQMQLVHEIDSSGFCGKYDFLHLPLDSSAKGSSLLSNVGFAFINFISEADLLKFVAAFDGRYSFQKHKNSKLARVVPAHIQGFDKNVHHFWESATGQSRAPHSRGTPMILLDGRQVDINEAARCSLRSTTTPQAQVIAAMEKPAIHVRTQGALWDDKKKPDGNFIEKTAMFLPQDVKLTPLELGELEVLLLSRAACAQAKASKAFDQACDNFKRQTAIGQQPSEVAFQAWQTYEELQMAAKLAAAPLETLAANFKQAPSHSEANPVSHHRIPSAFDSHAPMSINFSSLCTAPCGADDTDDLNPDGLFSEAKVEFERMLAGLLAQSPTAKTCEPATVGGVAESTISSTEADSGMGGSSGDESPRSAGTGLLEEYAPLARDSPAYVSMSSTPPRTGRSSAATNKVGKRF